MPRTVVVTGASRGIGLALVRAYAAAGDAVIAAARDPASAQALQALAAEGAVRVARLDVVDPASVTAFRDGLGGAPVDILINNAGVLGDAPQSLAEMDYDAWRQVLEVNTFAPLRVSAALLPNLAKAAGAKLITLTSTMGALSNDSPGLYAYRTSKAAANKMMQLMALDLRNRGIIACPIHPGWAQSDMGGPGAAITVGESAAGIFAVIERLVMQDSGRFWRWDGKENPW